MNSGIRIENNDDGFKDTMKIISYTGCTGYSLKIDHYGDNDAVNINSKALGFTPFTVNGINTSRSTLKIVNDAVQTDGSVITGWGTHPDKTTDVISAYQWGVGPCIRANLINERGVCYDADATGSVNVIAYNADILNATGGYGIRIKHNGRHSADSLGLLWNAHTLATAVSLNLVNEGSGQFVSCNKGSLQRFAVENSGAITTTTSRNVTYQTATQQTGSTVRNVLNDTTTTNNTSVNLFSFTTPNNTAYFFDAQITAIRTGGTALGSVGDSAVFTIRCGFKNVAGTLVLLGNIDKSAYKDTNAANWNVETSIVSTNIWRLLGTGDSNTNITWDVHVSRFGRLAGF